MSVLFASAALGAALAACTPHRYSAAFYEMPAEELRALEQRATERCAAVRTDGRLPPYPFTTDGCTLWPDGTWQQCCVEHDAVYWCGGSAADRRAADAALGRCVADHGHPLVGDLMYLGVRFGGHPLMPFPWRWGYGWDWPYRYDKLP